MLFRKLCINNEQELFEVLNLDLLIATAGKKGARFLFKENNEVKMITKSPKIIENMVDDTGAGDSFFAAIIKEYAYSSKIDEEFTKKAFDFASKISAKVINNFGSRIT